MSLPDEVARVLAGEARWAVVTGDCTAILPLLEARSVDVVLTDPPYSEHVHAKSRSGATLPDVADFSCRARRRVEFGFDAITRETMERCADDFARITRRWCLVFCNVELVDAWKSELTVSGLAYVRTLAWVKLGGTPQFTGDRPAAGFETMALAHPPGKKRWNGGGKAGVYSVPIEANRLGNRGARVHPTQKPLDLMLQLVEDFTDPDDLVLDPFCGSGTTGVAAVRLGRRFIGIEREPRWAELSRERLRAEDEHSTLADRRAGNLPLFGSR